MMLILKVILLELSTTSGNLSHSKSVSSSTFAASGSSKGDIYISPKRQNSDETDSRDCGKMIKRISTFHN